MLPIVLPVTTSSPLSSPFEEDEEERPGFVTPLEVPLSERQPRLSLSAQAHQQWVLKKTRRWHAVVAGAIAGGVAIMFEKRSRRLLIAQQLFVRSVFLFDSDSFAEHFAVDCRGHITRSRRNEGSISHMAICSYSLYGTLHL